MTLDELKARLAAKDVRYAALFGLPHGGAAPPPRPGKVALPCVHEGDPAGPKGWHVCEHPDEPLGMVVCSCRGCGTNCPGYTPDSSPKE